jgi:hypothetical protein
MMSLLFTNLALSNLGATLVLLFEMLFGGLLLNKQAVSKYLSWLFKMSFFNNALEAMVINEVNGLTLLEHKYGMDIDVR